MNSVFSLVLLWVVTTMALRILYRHRIETNWGTGVRSSLHVAVRSGIAFGVIGLIACRGFGVPGHKVGLAMLAGLLIPWEHAIAIHASDKLPLLMIVFGPLWGLQSLVVGFPSEVPAAVDHPKPLEEEYDAPVGAFGTVITPLCPIGTVDVDGQKWTAFTWDKRFVPVGKRVLVTDERMRALLVEVEKEPQT